MKSLYERLMTIDGERLIIDCDLERLGDYGVKVIVSQVAPENNWFFVNNNNILKWEGSK